MKQKTLHCALEIVGKICSFTKSPSGFVFICAFAEQDVPLPRCIDRWRRCFAISTFHSFLMRMTKIGYHFGPQRMVKQKKTGEYLQSCSVVFRHSFVCISVFIWITLWSARQQQNLAQQMGDTQGVDLDYISPRRARSADDAAFGTMKPNSCITFKLLMRVWVFHKNDKVAFYWNLLPSLEPSCLIMTCNLYKQAIKPLLI